MDLVEKANGFEIIVELPGINGKNVGIKLANKILTIKGEKTEENRRTTISRSGATAPSSDRSSCPTGC
ncbi:Hsp20/alpha crystallin family protein [Mesorhizobium sp. B2-7-3]|uniref:Hsp20 family protein n=1 Tax=Mesorhizobium sp. B2-7-3 TaxID=2589907 RepID=UPI001FEE61DF|nr:Hsp20/alpha crystallin family protein [Mesorhizobium sp. B2-7-3]